MTKLHLPMLLALAILAGCSAHDKPSASAPAEKATSPTPADKTTKPTVAVIVDVPAAPAAAAPQTPRIVAPQPQVHKQRAAAPELNPQELAALKARLAEPGH